MILGVDFGSSFTDAVLMNGESIKKTLNFQSNENLDFILFKLTGSHPELIAVTGAYSYKYDTKVKGIPIKHVDEIKAIGLGGLFVSKKKEALVVSIGSGTALVSCGVEMGHVGGTALGGRTITGLSKMLIGQEDLTKIEALAAKGNLDNVDLQLKDIYPEGIGLLPPSATASHFGNLKNYRDEDIALALMNMAAQTIGTLAVLGAAACKQSQIVLTGRLVTSNIFRKIITQRISTFTKIPISIPPNAEYATAMGAVIGSCL